MYKFEVLVCIQLLLICVSCGKNNKTDKSDISIKKNTPVVVENQKELFQQSSKSTVENIDSEAVSILKEFYAIELKSIIRKKEELKKNYAKYFTKAMRSKIWRMTWDAGTNMIIRAQDVPEDSCETLKIEPLGNSWYMVHYAYSRGTPYEGTKEIPVKVVKEDGEYRVGYITPESLGQQFGDSLWYSGGTFPKVDRNDPLDFVKSFYDLYTLNHSILSDNLLQELAAVRAEYLTPNALSRFNKMEELSSNDGYPEYDALIGRHDFEYPYRNDVWVHPTDKPDAFQVGVTGDTILINVVKQEDKYYINDIYNKEFESFLPIE